MTERRGLEDTNEVPLEKDTFLLFWLTFDTAASSPVDTSVSTSPQSEQLDVPSSSESIMATTGAAGVALALALLLAFSLASALPFAFPSFAGVA